MIFLQLMRRITHTLAEMFYYNITLYIIGENSEENEHIYE